MRLDVIPIARLWLGTPFQEGASVRSVGCDCAGLIEGIARDLGLASPDRQSVGADLLAAAYAFMTEANVAQAGNIVLLSRDPGGQPVHAALHTDTDTLIHAHWSAGVIENRFGSWFQRRVTHVFAWPQTGARLTLQNPPLSANTETDGLQVSRQTLESGQI